MWIDEVRRVAVRAVLGERPRRVEDIVTAARDPLVHAVDLGAGAHQERNVLEPNSVPRVLPGLQGGLQEELCALPVVGAVPVAETRLIPHHGHQLVVV